MKYHILSWIVVLVFGHVKGQDRIKVNIPSAKEEASFIWRTLQDIAFFDEHGYQVSLPKGAFIEKLKEKSKSGKLTHQDYERLERFIIDSVYDATDYQKGYDKIKNQRSLINQFVAVLDSSDYSWPFKLFNVYAVNLTLYGPGGSYDPEEGSILIFTTNQGQFKNYDNPANTIIHEIIHIGIEESIISKYNVPHPMKERIVDHLVSLHFSPFLPDYRIQDMGEYRLDPHLKTLSDIRELDKIIQHILY